MTKKRKKQVRLDSQRRIKEERRERIIIIITWLFAGLCGLLLILIGMGFAYNLLLG